VGPELQAAGSLELGTAPDPAWTPEVRARHLAAALTGVLVALTIWGGRLHVIPHALIASGIARPQPAARSANSQQASSFGQVLASTLTMCTPVRDTQRERQSYGGACAPARAATEHSASASPR
jgi:hypothetical protein